MKVPLAPDEGAVKVTTTPDTGLPPESFTVATNGEANAVLRPADCPPPLVAVIADAGPAMLVSENAAGPGCHDNDAIRQEHGLVDAVGYENNR